MFFAHRTKQRIRIAVVACIAYALLVAVVTVFFPREGNSLLSSFSWWLIAIPVGLATYAVLELFGTWSLGLTFWQRMPGWTRVLLLVVLIAIGTTAAVLVSQYVADYGTH